MKNKSIKKLVFMAILLTFFSVNTLYAKSININGIDISLNVSVEENLENKKNDSDNVENDSDKKYINEIVKVDLTIKNRNPYESCDITIKENVNRGFQDAINDSKITKVKLDKKEEKTFD